MGSVFLRKDSWVIEYKVNEGLYEPFGQLNTLYFL